MLSVMPLSLRTLKTKAHHSSHHFVITNTAKQIHRCAKKPYMSIVLTLGFYIDDNLKKTIFIVFDHEVCGVSARDHDERWIFYLGACTQGKYLTFIL